MITSFIRIDAEGQFNAGVLYEDRPIPGIRFRKYDTRKAAERGVAQMLRKAA